MHEVAWTNSGWSAEFIMDGTWHVQGVAVRVKVQRPPPYDAAVPTHKPGHLLHPSETRRLPR